MFRSVWDRVHYGTVHSVLHGTGSKLERHGSLWDHHYKWTHLEPDSRSDPNVIHQVPFKRKAYLYQCRTGLKRIPVPCKRCLRQLRLFILGPKFASA